MSPRLALRLAFARRRQVAADDARPSVLRVRSYAERVLCDTDLNAKPLIPRRYEQLASMVGAGVLLVVMWVGLWVGFHLLGEILNEH